MKVMNAHKILPGRFLFITRPPHSTLRSVRARDNAVVIIDRKVASNGDGIFLHAREDGGGFLRHAVR
jgi:hypothetical protein